MDPQHIDPAEPARVAESASPMADDPARAKEAEKRPDAPPTSRLGRLARLGALAPRALPMATEAMKRAVGMKRSDADEAAARAKVLTSAKKTAEAMLKT